MVESIIPTIGSGVLRNDESDGKSIMLRLRGQNLAMGTLNGHDTEKLSILSFLTDSDLNFQPHPPVNHTFVFF